MTDVTQSIADRIRRPKCRGPALPLVYDELRKLAAARLAEDATCHASIGWGWSEHTWFPVRGSAESGISTRAGNLLTVRGLESLKITSARALGSLLQLRCEFGG